MRDVVSNKMQSGGTRCPRCNRPLTEYGCREVQLGDYCVQWGLSYRQDRMQLPEPDPKIVAAEQDPQVKATALLERQATEKYDEITARWSDALCALNALRLRAQSDRGEFHGDRGWRPSPKVRELANREPLLSGQVEELTRERDRVGEEMVRARVAHQRALDDSYRRHGLGVMPSNLPPTGRTTIPAY